MSIWECMLTFLNEAFFFFFFKWSKTCNFCLTLPPPLPPLRPPPPPLCSRLQLSSRCVSEPCTTTKQVGSHLGGNGNARAPKVPALHHNCAAISGSFTMLSWVFTMFPQRTNQSSRSSPVTSSGTWRRWTKPGGGGGAKTAAKACSPPITWRPSRPVAQTHIHAQGHAPHVYSLDHYPPTETLCSYFEKFLFPLNMNEKNNNIIFSHIFKFCGKTTQPHFLG